MLICEATLNESGWIEVAFASSGAGNEKLGSEFNNFVRDWQKFYLVSHDYKVVIADIQTFLSDLRLWLEQVELKIQASPAADRTRIEHDIAHELRGPVGAALSNMFERFEEVSNKIEAEQHPAHRAFGQRQLHPHLLCAPFLHRTYTKPLGYAGDYEMINMIVRNGYEGASLFAKLINSYILNQAPARAVRNRAAFLTRRITEEASRIASSGGIARVYCLACGPAWEVQDFLTEHALSERAHFRLLDFNEETLRYTGNQLDEIKKRYHRSTRIELVRNSVQNLLKSAGMSTHQEHGHDLIYVSGLYDYLNDRVIKALNKYLYDQLLPGGILVVGNFASNPIRAFQEDIVEWFLIYRNGKELAALAPEHNSMECRAVAEPTGANIFLEIRKPK
jgi:extracellular factor (EF) 3-hydroxypalmitic acid methyl ester biosynthesis protein